MASISDEVKAELAAAAAGLREAGLADKVYRDECVVSFTLPQHAGGLYTNLSTFRTYAREYLAADVAASGCKVYLHQHWVKVPKETPSHIEDAAVVSSGGAAKVTDTGAEVYSFEDDWEWRKDYSLHLPASGTTVPYSEADTPEALAKVVKSVLQHDDAFRAAEIASAKVQFETRETKYADTLMHVEGAPQVSGDPSNWACATCGLKQNLWLNLSDGFIGCGRKQDGGEEGYSHALEHYNQTGGLYPLAVKLGTITPDGRADVYSYAPDENDMVLNPKLAEHLLRWGIDMTAQRKTAKRMGELNMDRNQLAELASITEGGRKHSTLVGAGYVGLRNLGNSCYMNSLFQVLMSMPEFQHALLPGHTPPGPGAGQASTASYEAAAKAELFTAAIAAGSAPTDLITQLRKLAVGMLTPRNVSTKAAEAAVAHATAAKAAGSISGEPDDPVEVARRAVGDAAEEDAIGPRQLRAVVGGSHPEFSSNRQQDVAEYFEHFLEVLGKAEKAAGPWAAGPGAAGAAAEGGAAEGAAAPLPPSLARMFSLATQNRKVDDSTGKVRYVDQETTWLQLPIPLDAATNPEEVAEYEAKRAAQEEIRAAREAAKKAAGGGDAGSEEAKHDDKRPRTEGAEDVAALAAKLGVDPDAKLEVVVPKVPFQACLDAWAAPEVIEGFKSPDTGAVGTATSTVRLATMPRYLVLTMRRYMVGDNWQPIKITADVPLPEELDLEPFRGKGLAEGEVEMAEGGGEAAAAPEPSPDIVAACCGMGFSENAGKRAALAVSNSSADEAVMWIMGHMDDPDLNDPLPPPGAAADAASGPTFPAEGVMMLTSMGFPEDAVKKALWECKMDVERASDWLLSNMDQLGSMDLSIDTSPPGGAELEDGQGKYELVGFVSHLGQTTAGGHYVAHVKRDGRWVFCNDRSVTLSQATPFGRGFLYVYRRKDAPALANQIGAPVALPGQA